MPRRNMDHVIDSSRVITDMVSDFMSDQKDPYKPTLVLYKGTVVDNDDEENRGRIKIRLLHFDDGVSDDHLDWYTPISNTVVLYLPSKGDTVYTLYEDIKNRRGGSWLHSLIKKDEWPEHVTDQKVLIRVKGSDNTAWYMEADESTTKLISNQTFIGNENMDLRTYINSHLEEMNEQIKAMAYRIETIVAANTAAINAVVPVVAASVGASGGGSGSGHTHAVLPAGGATGPPVTPPSSSIPSGGIGKLPLPNLNSLISEMNSRVEELKEKLDLFLSDNGEPYA